MDTRTTVAVVAVSAAAALIVSVAAWLVLEHRAPPAYPAHARLCASYDAKIAEATPDVDSPRAVVLAANANAAGCYMQR